MVTRHPGPHRQRGLRAAAARDRRAAGADHRRRGGQHHHAPQAQPRAQRAPRHPGPAGAGPRRRAAGGHGAAPRAGRAGVEGGVGGLPRGVPAHRRRPADGDRPARRAWRSTPRPWPPGSDAAGRRRSRSWPSSPPASAATGPRRRCTQALRPGAGGAAGRWPRRWWRRAARPADEVAGLLAAPAVEGAVAMVDEVVARGRAARAGEPRRGRRTVVHALARRTGDTAGVHQSERRPP